MWDDTKITKKALTVGKKFSNLFDRHCKTFHQSGNIEACS